MIRGRMIVIFLVLMLLSIIGEAAGSGASSLTSKEASAGNAARLPTNAAATGARSAPSAKDSGTATPSSTNSSTDSSPEGNKTDPPSTASAGTASFDGSPSIKATKKRGVSVPVAAQGDENPTSLFEDEKGFLAGLDYPELQVVPRASERLQMEAQEERSSFMSNYWPVQISAITLMLAGSAASGKYKEADPTEVQKKENQFASQMGLLIGGTWLGATLYLDHVLSYGNALPEIRKINGKDKKSQLLKERLSEEALERPAKVASMINNISVWSSVGLALYINAHSRQTLPSYAGLALGVSFLPWLIDNRIIENWQKHQEYKRKIYAPLTRIDFTLDPANHQPMPLLSLQWRF